MKNKSINELTQNTKEKIVIFGFKDGLVGQFLEMAQISKSYDIEYFISIEELPDLNIDHEHRKRPNSKTEFIENGEIFGAPIHVDSEYIGRLSSDNISKVFVLENDNNKRASIIKRLLKAKIDVLSFIHESVWLGGNNFLGVGVIIFPMCYIGYKADIGKGTIIQSNSTIEHHNVVGECCDICPNVTTGGFTYIGDFSAVQISTTIINRISIGQNCRIGAGSLVLKDCEHDFLYYGVPAKKIRKTSEN